jgi:hypothetical protein
MMPAEYSMESLHDANWCCGRFFFVFLIYLESFYPGLQDFKEKVKQFLNDFFKSHVFVHSLYSNSILKVTV